ncbi:MAG: hypothetical protein ACRC9R_00980, partial [Enterovibrio sp.]
MELARTLLRRHSMLHLAELQLELALGSLQRHDVHNLGAVQTAALDEARMALVADIDRARRAVEDERRRLDDARGEAERLFPNIDFSLAGAPPPLTEGAAAQPAPDGDGQVVTATLVDLSLPADLTADEGEAGASASISLQALRVRSQDFSYAIFRGVETAAEGRRRLTAVQNRAAAAADQCPTSPISPQVRAAFSLVNAQLNTQNTLPGSQESRRNLMLHLNNAMSRQILAAMPADGAQLRAFFSDPHAESGLSGLSLLQMLTATLRASPSEAIRAQMNEILDANTVNGIPLVQLLDRTHAQFLLPEDALATILSPIPATTNRRMRPFLYSALEICRLMLSELQLQSVTQPSISGMRTQADRLLATLSTLHTNATAEDEEFPPPPSELTQAPLATGGQDTSAASQQSSST